MARGYSSYVNAQVTFKTGGTYTGDGVNGWAAGTSYTIAGKGRRKRLSRPKEDTTDSGYQSQVGGPVGYHVEFEGFFKSSTGTGAPTIPPHTLTDEFIHIAVTIGFLLTAVIMVSEFEEVGVIGTALNFKLAGDTDGTFTDA